jgi:hypothetical protein
MKKIKWELIPEEKLKEWAEVLKFDLKILEATYFHYYKDKITKNEYCASMILERLSTGFYDNIIVEIKEGDYYGYKDKIDFGELQKNNEDLFKFLINASPYWRGKNNLSESVEPEKKELERRIDTLNSYLEKKYGK